MKRILYISVVLFIFLGAHISPTSLAAQTLIPQNPEELLNSLLETYSDEYYEIGFNCLKSSHNEEFYIDLWLRASANKMVGTAFNMGFIYLTRSGDMGHFRYTFYSKSHGDDPCPPPDKMGSIMEAKGFVLVETRSGKKYVSPTSPDGQQNEFPILIISIGIVFILVMCRFLVSVTPTQNSIKTQPRTNG